MKAPLIPVIAEQGDVSFEQDNLFLSATFKPDSKYKGIGDK